MRLVELAELEAELEAAETVEESSYAAESSSLIFYDSY